jgi:hypothetical protein
LKLISGQESDRKRLGGVENIESRRTQAEALRYPIERLNRWNDWNGPRYWTAQRLKCLIQSNRLAIGVECGCKRNRTGEKNKSILKHDPNSNSC